MFNELLNDILQGEDEIGGVSQDIIKALLLSEDEKHWEMVGKEADVDIEAPQDCLAKFRSNRLFGWIVLVGAVTAQLTAA